MASDPSRRPRLYVLPPSHFCERARWALDLAGIDYDEQGWAVGLHIPLARRLAAATTLPVLDTGREVIQGSGRIVDWTGLQGGDEALERRFEDRIGPLVRQYLYAVTLGDPKSGVREMLLTGVSPAQAALARLAWPILRRAMKTGMNARHELVAGLQRELDAELAWFDRQLGEKTVLHSETIGRAQITAASLLGPLASPAERPIYRVLVLPSEVGAVLEAWKLRPTVKWVEQMYSRHRHPSRDSSGLAERVR